MDVVDPLTTQLQQTHPDPQAELLFIQERIRARLLVGRRAVRRSRLVSPTTLPWACQEHTRAEPPGAWQRSNILIHDVLYGLVSGRASEKESRRACAVSLPADPETAHTHMSVEHMQWRARGPAAVRRHAGAARGGTLDGAGIHGVVAPRVRKIQTSWSRVLSQP